MNAVAVRLIPGKSTLIAVVLKVATKNQILITQL